MRKSEFGIFSGKELLEFEDSGGAPLIEGMLWDRDSILFLGREKAGKSIFCMQMACCLTAGEPFLDNFNVPTPVPILYFQAEGKRCETIRRLKSMLKVVPCNPDLFYLMYYPSLALDKDHGLKEMTNLIDQVEHLPKVIFIDPLYMSMAGALTDDYACRHMVANMRLLGERYAAAIVIAHHTHRPKRDAGGHYIQEGDDAVYGSFVWKAFADHTLMLSVNKDKSRTLTCDTQRSAQVPEKTDVTMVQPDPLFFELKEDAAPYTAAVLANVQIAGKIGLTTQDIIERTGLSRSAACKALRELLGIKKVHRPEPNKRPVRYVICT